MQEDNQKQAIDNIEYLLKQNCGNFTVKELSFLMSFEKYDSGYSSSQLWLLKQQETLDQINYLMFRLMY